MSLLQPYSGKFVSAKSASEKLDAEAIIAGCDAVDSEAETITAIEREVNSSGNMITADVLSIGGKTILPTLEATCTGITNNKAAIIAKTAEIRQQAEAVYNQIQSELNDEASRKDQEQEAAYNRQLAENRSN